MEEILQRHARGLRTQRRHRGSAKMWGLLSVVTILTATSVAWFLLTRPAKSAYSVDLTQIEKAFSDGLAKDPFLDKDADIIQLLKGKSKLLDPAEESLDATEHQARLSGLYMLTVGALEALGEQNVPDKREGLRASAERFVAQARVELKELAGTPKLPMTFDAARFEGNIRFLGALTWVMDGNIPDASCLEDLRFSIEQSHRMV